MRFLRKLLPALLLITGLLSAGPAFSADDKKPVKPPTRQTQTIRAETFKKMEEAQKAYEAKDYAGALRSLDELKAKFDKLNDYEKASLWNFYAAVYYGKDDLAKTREAYLNVLKQANLPEGLRNTSMYALAQLYFIAEDYDKAIALIQQWLQLVPEPQPDGHVLIAQAYYQQQKYAPAEKSLLEALRIAKARQQTPKENWLALLRAVYYELKQYERSAKVLELLVTYYPSKATYWQQLAGMYGLLDRQSDQTKVLHAAYQVGLVSSETDLLNLARLYMVQDAPYPAVRVLDAGFRTKTIKVNAETLQLFAQALALAKEYEQQAPVLEKLAAMTGEAKHYAYLGQAQAELGKWPEAAASFRAALKGKNPDNSANLRMQLGTALFNAGQLEEARAVFLAATESEAVSESARNWVKFVSLEIQRNEALGGG